MQQRHFDCFTRHHVPFDEHWNRLQHLESYSYEFVAFKGTVWNELTSLLRQSHEPTIIYCPPQGHPLYRGGSKMEFVKRILSLVQRNHSDALLWKPEIQSDGRPVILDLVNDADRRAKTAFVMDHDCSVAAIITVGMFKEGADWPQASRIIDLNPSGSDQDRNQRFGRLIRDYPGKKHVSYFSFFQHVADAPAEMQREQLTKLFAHFHASLVLENALNPVVVADTRCDKSRSERRSRRPTINPLGEFDTQKQESIVRACCERLIALAAQVNEDQFIPGTTAKEALVEVLNDDFQIADHAEEMAKQIVIMLRRRRDPKVSAVDLVTAGFGELWSKESLDGITLYSAGVGGPRTFRQIRHAVQNAFELQWNETFATVHDMPVAPDSTSSEYWWCAHNKSLHSEDKLPAERAELLEGISWWSWATGFGERWLQRWDTVRQLEKCPKAGTQEYSWVRTQRRLYAAGRLTVWKIRRCEQIGWWKWTTATSNWEATFNKIKSLRRPPAARTPEYDWVKHQRRMFHKNRLDRSRIQLLEKISWWTWKKKTVKAWLAQWRLAKDLQTPPRSRDPLYSWVRKQKQRFHSAELVNDQITRCEQIAWWEWK